MVDEDGCGFIRVNWLVNFFFPYCDAMARPPFVSRIGFDDEVEIYIKLSCIFFMIFFFYSIS